MRFYHRLIRNLVLPSNARPSDPRIVIGPDVPAELQQHYAGKITSAILWYYSDPSGDASHTYHYYAVYSHPGGVPSGAAIRGDVISGVVIPLDLYSGADMSMYRTIQFTDGGIPGDSGGFTVASGSFARFASGTVFYNNVQVGVWLPYVPQLLASTTNPTLGTGFAREGTYIVDPFTRMVQGWFRISFGSSGFDPGAGNYQITLPTAVDGSIPGSPGATGVAENIGTFSFRDSGALSNSRGGTLVLGSPNGGPDGVGLAQMGIYDGSTTFITANNPIVPGSDDGYAGRFVYRLP